MSIHHPAPLFEELTTETEIFRRASKAIDLLDLMFGQKGATSLGSASVGKTVLIQELVLAWLSSMVVLHTGVGERTREVPDLFLE